MNRALALAARGIGFVEPNPPVGAVLVDEGRRLLGEGWHQRFGEPHAEVHALAAAGERARGATLFVTLEPCCHHGKTPPCTRAILAAGIRRVVIAMSDPAPYVAGRGIAELRVAGLDVEVGLREGQAVRLVAPFVKRVTAGLPWVHGKWAMTLDGKLAARTGHSQWISGENSREIVHRLRGRMDAILVGIGTVLADNPLLTARPSGPRVALRVVLDSTARTPLTSRLVQTVDEAPLSIAVSESAPAERVARLREAGVDVFVVPPVNRGADAPRSPAAPAVPMLDLAILLRELAARSATNVLVEGGSQVLGSCFDAGVLDEVHVFVAPKLVGGREAATPLGGCGLERIPAAGSIETLELQFPGDDVYLHGRIIRAQ
ncbi:MAG: bifunctional diaminohydroxyphosphoribosylaminopyrimidine deaminase/5-amino-6-(5-phosphoribosylamino)uracil reductase RibD [Planctomycetes bacterium]|nr:bifunctional diaminohydroxyphosphoribosylaminopyrimidine deaminase/5-amino-6-(5-phosphoribosylamino)uracil reductase RibD [Planctomycetota bacterium]